MKTDPVIRTLFWLTAVLILVILVLSSAEAGISGDEEVHFNQSLKVYDYFATFGRDKSALDTPTTHLQYYGQSFDNLVTIASKWFNIRDIYLLRHLANGLAAWVAILLAAFLAIWLSGYRAGLITLMLFALSPTFLGHAQNNLKDIPFALAYVAAAFALLKWISAQGNRRKESLWLILSSAFCLSIRPGGLLIFCYLLFFIFLSEWINYMGTRSLNLVHLRKLVLSALGIIALSWVLGILLWPYALENPVSGVWKSYHIMTQFPVTIRQLFEGKREWSDLMPWYYLPKLMLLTIPLLVWAGILAFLSTVRRIREQDLTRYALLIFMILFPVLFVIWEKSNLYGSWRHFLFVYPLMVVVAAIGFSQLAGWLETRTRQIILVLVCAGLAWHPARFMIRNHPLYYLYYNQLAGGLKGAYGQYETDYYYHTIREGSEWLIHHLPADRKGDTVRVGSNFPAAWFFREQRKIVTGYFPYTERSQHDWDYYIVANSYIPAALLKSGKWPPANSIKIFDADGVPVCAVLGRETRDDLKGYLALEQGQYAKAAGYFEEVIKNSCTDELIFYNFAAACYKLENREKALDLLRRGYAINPESEEILALEAKIRAEGGETEKAGDLYRELIRINRKCFWAYPALAKILMDHNEVKNARELLKSCLVLNPKYRDAITGLADTYRSSDPGVAAKYDELAKTIK